MLYCQQVLDDLLITFGNDFAKYRKRVPALRIREVFESVAHQSEGKFVYNRAGEGLTNSQVKQALDLLEMAGLVYSVMHTSANGIPLGAESDPKYRRIFMLDTGLFQRVLDLNVSAFFTDGDFKSINRGAIAEMFVGLELLKNVSPYKPAQLFCWHREKDKSNAQVDFVVQSNDRIIPIEVKSGTKGSMQSLRLFMEEKNIEKGIRTSQENFGQIENIDIYPMYAISNILRF